MKALDSETLQKLQFLAGALCLGSLALALSPLTLFVSVEPKAGHVVVKTLPPDSDVSLLAPMGSTRPTTSLGKGYEAIPLTKLFRADLPRRSLTLFVTRPGFKRKELIIAGENELERIRKSGVIPTDGSVLTLEEEAQNYLGIKLKRRWPVFLLSLFSGIALTWLLHRRRAIMKRLAGLEQAEASDVAHPFLGVDVGEYRVIEFVGRGGMADVYKAVPRHLLDTERAAKHEVVVKFCKGIEASRAEKVYQELQIAQKIQHPNAVKIYEEGCLRTGSDNTVREIPYLVMEYVPGKTLWQLATENGKPMLSQELLVKYLEPAVEALQHAHNVGVIHRDFTPNNIMITPDEKIKVLDFGLSKIIDSPNSAMTTMTLGTPYYLSPEQQRKDKGVDARTDQFALGAIFFQFLTGASPYGTEDHEIQQNLAEEKIIVSPLRKNTDCSPEVRAVIEKMLATSPAERYDTIAEAFSEFKRAVENS